MPGWILNEDGLWVRDPSDERLRDGIDLTYTDQPDGDGDGAVSAGVLGVRQPGEYDDHDDDAAAGDDDHRRR